MMKRKEEIDALRKEIAELNKILNRLSDEDLEQVVGGSKPTHVNVSVVMAEADGTCY